MKLETEFRLRLQLMQLEQTFDRPDVDCATITPATGFLPPLEPQPSTWVKLVQAPSLFSHDEALLLCSVSDYQWLAWIPDYGEIVLDREEFYQCWDETA